MDQLNMTLSLLKIKIILFVKMWSLKSQNNKDTIHDIIRSSCRSLEGHRNGALRCVSNTVLHRK